MSIINNKNIKIKIIAALVPTGHFVHAACKRRSYPQVILCAPLISGARSERVKFCLLYEKNSFAEVSKNFRANFVRLSK